MKARGLASGIVIGAFTFVIAHVAGVSGVGPACINPDGGFHRGNSPTWFGACIMTLWMSVYGFIGSGALAFTCNYFAKGEKTA